jgi:hypothetical protein
MSSDRVLAPAYNRLQQGPVVDLPMNCHSLWWPGDEERSCCLLCWQRLADIGEWQRESTLNFEARATVPRYGALHRKPPVRLRTVSSDIGTNIALTHLAAPANRLAAARPLICPLRWGVRRKHWAGGRPLFSIVDQKMSIWKVSHQPKHNYRLAPGSEAILYRQFGDRWYVAQASWAEVTRKKFTASTASISRHGGRRWPMLRRWRKDSLSRHYKLWQARAERVMVETAPFLKSRPVAWHRHCGIDSTNPGGWRLLMRPGAGLLGRPSRCDTAVNQY